MSLPMLNAITMNDSESHITWLCGRTAASLLSATNKVQELVEIDESKLFGQGWARWLEFFRIWLRFAGKRYDSILICHRDYRYRLLVSGARARRLVRFNHKGVHPSPIPGRYYGYEYVRLATASDGPQVSIYLSPALTLPPMPRLDQALAAAPRPWVVLAPGGAKNALRDQPLKRWPLNNYVRLADALLKQRYGVVVVGSHSDAWVLSAFSGLDIVNLIGQTNVLELIYVFKSCNGFVTHDSGPMHLAGLVGAPIVALFGPTDPAMFAPRNANIQALKGLRELPCRPCYDGYSYRDCQNNLCMQDISLPQVLDSVLKMLAAPVRARHN